MINEVEKTELLPCPFEAERHLIKTTSLPTMVRCYLHTKWLFPEQWNHQSLQVRVLELERRLKIPFGKLPCAQCGGPHGFDTSVDSKQWNKVIRAKGLPEYLCTTCIVREFAKAGVSFNATLWSEELNGVPISVAVNTRVSKSADIRTQAERAAEKIVDDFDHGALAVFSLRHLKVSHVAAIIESEFATSDIRTQAWEEAAKAICKFCAAPEIYKAAVLVEGSMRLWHLYHDNRESQHFQCEASAIRALSTSTPQPATLAEENKKLERDA